MQIKIKRVEHPIQVRHSLVWHRRKYNSKTSLVNRDTKSLHITNAIIKKSLNRINASKIFIGLSRHKRKSKSRWKSRGFNARKISIGLTSQILKKKPLVEQPMQVRHPLVGIVTNTNQKSCEHPMQVRHSLDIIQQAIVNLLTHKRIGRQ